MLDPAAVQQALAQDGIPALVKINTICSSNPALPGPASIGALTVQVPGVNPADPGPHRVLIPANAVTVINPAAMPAGTKLFLGYVNSGRVHTLNPRLIYANSYTCAGVAPGGPGGSKSAEWRPPITVL